MATQILAGTGAAAIGVYLYNKYGYWDGITNPAEVQGLDILGGAVFAMLMSYLMSGGGFSGDNLLMYLIEGAAGVAIEKLVVKATGQ